MTTAELENKAKEMRSTCEAVKRLCNLYAACCSEFNYPVANKLKGTIAEILGGYGPAYIELARFYAAQDDGKLEAANYYADFLARYQERNPEYVAEAEAAVKLRK